VSSLSMRHSIMTEKIARRGLRVVNDYAADLLEQLHVSDVATQNVVTLHGAQTCAEVRAWIASHGEGADHQGFPVLDDKGRLIGLVLRREILAPGAPEHVRDLIHRPPAVAYADSSLREAADHMVVERVGRLPVVTRKEPRRVVGILSRGDLVGVHVRRIDAERRGAFRRRLRREDPVAVSSPQ
jgi:CBS domain-containing protein